jgi:maltose alpha-D-glucosyltransferase/alpha-amylase
MAHSLMLSLPGTPVLRYGDEIGMGENLSLPERDAIRTPMQWANAKNGGFSPAQPRLMPLPPIRGGEFGYETVNVAAQQRDPESLLNWLERMMRLRMRSPEFGNGRCDWLEVSDPAVLAHCCSGERSSVIAVHNLSRRKVDVEVKLSKQVDGVWDLLKNREYKVGASGRHKFQLPPYGYMWLREGRGPESMAGAID